MFWLTGEETLAMILWKYPTTLVVHEEIVLELEKFSSEKILKINLCLLDGNLITRRDMKYFKKNLRHIILRCVCIHLYNRKIKFELDKIDWSE